jgi:hypothetical protein
MADIERLPKWACSIIAPAPGTEVQLPTDVMVFARPDEKANTPLKLDAKMPVIYQGSENGFARFTAPNVDRPFYVKDYKFIDWGGATSIGRIASGSLKGATETLKGLANELRDNPYVRMKGFTVDVSSSPGLKVDFEMRDAAGSPGASGTPMPTK